eukprot:XP_020398571.1 uncharacterized protein LOC109941769 [Zea mays]
MAASLRAAAWLGQPAWRPVDSLRATACGPPAWLARGWVRAQQRGLPAQMPRRARVQQPHTGSSSARPACLVFCTPGMPRRLPSLQGGPHVLSPPLLPLSALRSPFPAHVNGGSNSSGGQPLTTVPAGEPSPPLSLPLPPLVAVSSPPRFLPCASARLRGGRRARPAAHPGALKRGGEPLAARRVQLAAVAASQLAAAATYQLGAATARAPSRGVAACQLAAATARVTFRSMAASLRAAAWLGKPAWRPVDNLRATACGPPAWLARGWVRAQQRGLPAQMPRRARVQQPHTGSSSARLTCLVVCTPDMPRRLPSSQGTLKEIAMVQYLQKIPGVVHLAAGDPALGFAPAL